MSTFRLSMIMYTAVFVITFIYYRRSVWKGTFSRLYYMKLLRLLIYSFCVVLIIQQICVIMGFPVFNMILGSETLSEGISHSGAPLPSRNPRCRR